jgi:hypothetical protein
VFGLLWATIPVTPAGNGIPFTLVKMFWWKKGQNPRRIGVGRAG